MVALVAAVLVQGACAEDMGYTLYTTFGGSGSGIGQLNTPNGIAVDTAGNVYVADADNDRIQKFDDDGTFITKWGSHGSGDGQFDKPWSVAVDAAGNVFVVDMSNYRIQIFNIHGNLIDTWGGIGEFNIPTGVAVDAAGNVYVTDYGTPYTQKFDANGKFIREWRYYGPGYRMEMPSRVAVNAAGNVYVLYHGRDLGSSTGGSITHNYIQKYDSNGNFILKWGPIGTSNEQLNNPKDLAVDSADNVYVADYGNDRIQKFDADGNYRATLHCDNPRAITVDAADRIYVSSDNYIHIFVPAVPPVADAGGDRIIPAGWAVTFDATSSYDPDMEIVSYEWWFSENETVTEPVITRVYDAPGIYYATLTVTDTTNLTDSDTIEINVTPKEIDPPMEATTELITDIEALDLPRGTERKVVTKLEEVLRYLAHANEKLAAASAELEGEAPDELLDRICAIMESITGESGDLPTLFVTRTSPQVVGAPVSQATENTPDETGSPGSPDTKGPNEHSVKDTKEKKDNPGQNKK